LSAEVRSRLESVLTSGGGLSGIDVADNDHVDVHLLLTAERRVVSKLPMAFEITIVKMLATEGREGKV
jgi:hypothetical protein